MGGRGALLIELVSKRARDLLIGGHLFWAKPVHDKARMNDVTGLGKSIGGEVISAYRTPYSYTQQRST